MAIRQLARLVGSTLVGVLVLGCSDSLTEVTVSEVTIGGAQPTLRIGETMQLQAITSNASGRALEGQDVTWLTSDGSIAQVSLAGLVTGVAPGAARISARSGGATGTIEVAVNTILTIRGAGNGDGTVHGPSGSGVSCTITAGNGNCQFPLASAQLVPLTAAATPGRHTFGGWSDACSGAAECQVAMSADRTVTATFASGFVLTVQPSGSGQGAVTGSGGINCVVAAGGTTSGTCRAPFAPGAAVSLTAAPSDGTLFGGWGGMGCSGTALTCQLTVSADGTVTVDFTPTFRLTVLAGGSGQGLVIGPAGIRCNISGSAVSGTCQSQIPAGSPVTLAATATAFSHSFTGWGGACSGTASVCQLTMAADRTVHANFRDPCANLDYVLGTIVSGELTSTSCATSDFPGGYRHDRYAYEPTNQSLVRFTLISSAISPRMLPVVPANRDFGLWYNSAEANLTITALVRPGKYLLLGGTSNPTRLGSYALASELIAPSAVTGCGDVFTTIGVTSSFTLGNACPYVPQGVSGSFHAFRLPVNMNSGPLRVRVSSSAFAPLVELRNPQGQVVATTLGQTGNTVELQLTPLSAVIIYVTSRVGGQTGAFTIAIDP